MHPLKAQIQASIAKQINEAMQGQDGVWETIKECSTYEEALRAMLRNLNESEAMVKSIGTLIDQYTKRNQRYKKQAEHWRAFIAEMMNTAGIRDIPPLPEGTIYYRSIPPSVIVTDVNLLPSDCVELKPKKTEIAKRLKAGEQLDGATLSNGGEAISIRLS